MYICINIHIFQIIKKEITEMTVVDIDLQGQL